MFEDSLVESRGFEVSSSKRWTTLGSIGLQVAVAGVVIALPLLHPEALPFRFEAPRVLVPLAPKPAVLVERVRGVASASPSSMLMSNTTRPLIDTSSLIRDPAPNDGPQLASIRMGMPDGLPIGPESESVMGMGRLCLWLRRERLPFRLKFRPGCWRGC